MQVVPAAGRNLLVYTPASYRRGDARYPVIYMQDGQNLFDAATSFAGDWGLKTALAWASRRGFETIVVGIPNLGTARIDEYTPFVDPKVGGGHGERYLEYLIHTVKPLIDARFRTLPDRAHTGIAGSSLGGLISLYAFFRYPEVFGFTAALSPSLWYANAAILAFVEHAPPVPGRVYLDVGLREGAAHVALARRLRDILVEKGYEPRVALRWVEDREGSHHESAWGRRFRKALPFLLRNGKAG
ncbi:MAG TPA: alpha/beta hydrolase-fold protein [Gemmatimonadales bacterium]|nr:alpha/beta hydrolase-fold protein [Gemmatimonadales bacterium]